MFCARTHAAVVAFQVDQGLKPTGDVDEDTWSALIESGWSLGERLLYERTPHLRGDDVAELQSALNRLGFDCGRVDGIYGPLAARAVALFQSNCGIDPTGVCTPEVVDLIGRLGTQSGHGPGVAVVREGVALGDAALRREARLVIGHFPGMSSLAHSLTRRLHDQFHLTTNVDSDAVSQARAANLFAADAYIGLEVSPDRGTTVRFYEVPTFVSVGGRNLADRVARAIGRSVPEFPCQSEGMRHPVLRETKMPAILCSIGPDEIVGPKQQALASAIGSAWAEWWTDPLSSPS